MYQSYAPPRTRQECYARTSSPIGQQLAIQARYVHPEVRRTLLLLGIAVLVLLLAMLVGHWIDMANSDAWYRQNIYN